jgi:hypothetical protein
MKLIIKQVIIIMNVINKLKSKKNQQSNSQAPLPPAIEQLSKIEEPKSSF